MKKQTKNKNRKKKESYDAYILKTEEFIKNRSEKWYLKNKNV